MLTASTRATIQRGTKKLAAKQCRDEDCQGRNVELINGAEHMWAPGRTAATCTAASSSTIIPTANLYSVLGRSGLADEDSTSSQFEHGGGRGTEGLGCIHDHDSTSLRVGLTNPKNHHTGALLRSASVLRQKQGGSQINGRALWGRVPNSLGWYFEWQNESCIPQRNWEHMSLGLGPQTPSPVRRFDGLHIATVLLMYWGKRAGIAWLSKKAI